MIATTKQRSAVAGLGLLASVLVGIALQEGYAPEAKVPVPGDRPTKGFGNATPGIKLGEKVTVERALTDLYTQLEGDYVNKLKKCIKVPVYDYELGAYTSLAYNVGAETVCRSSGDPAKPNLIDLLNSKRYAEACARIDKFVYGPGKKILPGLVKRRAAERKMCEGGLD